MALCLLQTFHFHDLVPYRNATICMDQSFTFTLFSVQKCHNSDVDSARQGTIRHNIAYLCHCEIHRIIEKKKRNRVFYCNCLKNHYIESIFIRILKLFHLMVIALQVCKDTAMNAFVRNTWGRPLLIGQFVLLIKPNQKNKIFNMVGDQCNPPFTKYINT